MAANITSTARATNVRRPLLWQGLHFAWNSGGGLAVDFGVFALLIALGTPAFVANVISSAAAITTVYVLSTRFAFKVRPHFASYAVFVVWYGASAAISSTVIAQLSDGSTSKAFAIKLAIVPMSFGANFIFGRWLFNGGAEAMAIEIRRALAPAAPAMSMELEVRHVRRIMTTARVRRRAVKIASAVTLAYAVAVLPMTDSESFVQNAGGQTVVIQYVLRGCMLALIWLVVAYGVRFAAALRAHSLRHIRWLKASAASLALNLVLLAAIWPGFWLWDEFYVIQSARAYSTDAWQGYATNVFYTFGLYLFPGPIGIVAFQLLFIAVVVGFAVSTVQSELRRPWLGLALFVPLLSFPVLLNNEYPLRLTMYGYLLLLLVVRIARCFRTRGADSSVLGFLGDALIISLLAFWRTEGLPFLILIPVMFFWRRGVFRRWFSRREVSSAMIGAVVIAGVVGGASVLTSNPGYSMPPLVNVLQSMLQGDLQSPHLDSDIRAINAVAKVRIIRRYSDCTESMAFWNGAVQQNVDKQMPAFRSAVVDLVLHNPAVFLQNRVCVFENANSMGAWLPQVQQGGIWSGPAREQQLSQFVATNLLTKPLDLRLKNKVERGLLLWTAKQQMTLPSRVLWNSMPTIAGLAVLLALGLAIRRFRLVGLLAAVVLVDAVAVFLTEPAAYFMYFFPVYLAGGVLIAACVAVLLDRWLSGREGRGRLATTDTTERPAMEPVERKAVAHV